MSGGHMTRFYGSVAARGTRRDAVPGAAALEDAFRANPAATLQVRRTDGGLVAVDAGATPADLWADGRSFAMVHGAPRVTGDAAFAASVREHGLARACALQYAATGPSFLAALKGSFALAIRLDDDDRTLLAIDQLGVYPAYYAATAAELAFSNHLGAMPHIVGTEIDSQAVYDYLYFHQIPGPGTVYKGIRRLGAGEFLERRGGEQRLDRHWTMHFRREDDAIDFAAEKAEFVEILRGTVRRELESQREIGCFLSGGTDSSTLAGMVTAVGGQPARTYSIGFEQKGFDEMEYARIAARHFGTRQREYYLQPSDIVNFAPRIAEIYGQPFGNSSVVPTFYCATMARADGVQAMIAGDGGDELFGGNQRYATQQLFSYYTGLPAPLRRYALEPLAFKTPGARGIMPLRKLGRYIEQALEPMPDRLQTYNYLNLLGHDVVFDPAFLGAVDTTSPRRAFAAPYDQAESRSMLNKMMALDLKFTLTDNDLPKVVEACAAAGVQVGFPFLHHEVVEFAARLPARQKVSRLRLRYFFKKALGDFLPVEIIRKKKHGFGMPFGDWLLVDKPLRDLAFDSMSTLKGRGIVRAQFIDDLCNARLRSHPNYYGGFMWILMILELWCQWQASQGRRVAFARSAPGHE